VAQPAHVSLYTVGSISGVNRQARCVTIVRLQRCAVCAHCYWQRATCSSTQAHEQFTRCRDLHDALRISKNEVCSSVLRALTHHTSNTLLREVYIYEQIVALVELQDLLCNVSGSNFDLLTLIQYTAMPVQPLKVLPMQS
jgi:hypothetical protein